MDIKKIIQEEINDFEWTDEVSVPKYHVGDTVVVDTRENGHTHGKIQKVISPSERMSFTNPEFEKMVYIVDLNDDRGWPIGTVYSDGTDIVGIDRNFIRWW